MNVGLLRIPPVL